MFSPPNAFHAPSTHPVWKVSRIISSRHGISQIMFSHYIYIHRVLLSPAFVWHCYPAVFTLVYVPFISSGIRLLFWWRFVCCVKDVSFGTISAAYLLRAARLVVVYDRDLRRKYQRQVNPSTQRKCMAAALVPCCLIALLIQLRCDGATSNPWLRRH